MLSHLGSVRLHGRQHVQHSPCCTRQRYCLLSGTTVHVRGCLLSNTCPVLGTQNDPVWLHSGSLENYMAALGGGNRLFTIHNMFAANDTSDYLHDVLLDASRSFFVPNSINSTRPSRPAPRTTNLAISRRDGTRTPRQASDYWLTTLGPLGSVRALPCRMEAVIESPSDKALIPRPRQQPLAGAGYKFYRDVTSYGAKDDGVHDDTESINAAIQDGNRCGEECANTFTHGAIIYFPVRRPARLRPRSPLTIESVYSLGPRRSAVPLYSSLSFVVPFSDFIKRMADGPARLYYTQFIGHPTNRPTIVGCPTFRGIGLIDTDPYIPGG